MKTKKYFATIIIWFMYLARGMDFFKKKTSILFLNYVEYYKRKAKYTENIFKKAQRKK